MSKNIRPFPGFVVLERIVTTEKLPGGLQLPDGAKEQPYIGKVLSFGKDINNTGISLKTGETLLFEKYGVHEITLDFKEYIVAPYDKLIGNIEDK